MNAAGVTGLTSRSLRTLARGFLLGVGFGLALLGAYAAVWHWTMKTEATAIAEIAPDASAASKSIQLSNVEEIKKDGAIWIIGSARNSATRVQRGLQVQANLFDHGKFVDQYSTYIAGGIKPGESKFFKIACGCKESAPAEHDSFKVEVVGGY